jgi:hypothetical protein
MGIGNDYSVIKENSCLFRELDSELVKIIATIPKEACRPRDLGGKLRDKNREPEVWLSALDSQLLTVDQIPQVVA